MGGWEWVGQGWGLVFPRWRRAEARILRMVAVVCFLPRRAALRARMRARTCGRFIARRIPASRLARTTGSCQVEVAEAEILARLSSLHFHPRLRAVFFAATFAATFAAPFAALLTARLTAVFAARLRGADFFRGLGVGGVGVIRQLYNLGRKR